eukprot:3057294-Rhodomonas_salina.1
MGSRRCRMTIRMPEGGQGGSCWVPPQAHWEATSDYGWGGEGEADGRGGRERNHERQDLTRHD